LAQDVPRNGQSPAGLADIRLLDVPVNAIRPNPRQPRRTIEPEALEELARSIASAGIVQPLVVRPLEGERFELIAGERRWRAAQLAGFTVVPVILRSASDVESLELSLIENVVRQQLNPIDEAYALHVLLEDLGVTKEELSARIGKSRPALSNKLRLLELASPVQDLLIDGQLSEGHGRALLGAPSRGAQIKLARRAATGGWSVRRVEGEVKRLLGDDAEKTAGTVQISVPPEVLDEARERFYALLDVVPRIKLQARGGRIELPFRSFEELRAVLDRLAGV